MPAVTSKHLQDEGIEAAELNLNMCVDCVMEGLESILYAKTPKWCKFVNEDYLKYFNKMPDKPIRCCTNCYEAGRECYQLPESRVDTIKNIFSRLLEDEEPPRSGVVLPYELRMDSGWRRAAKDLMVDLNVSYAYAIANKKSTFPLYTDATVLGNTGPDFVDNNNATRVTSECTPRPDLLLAVAEGVQVLLSEHNTGSANTLGNKLKALIASFEDGK